MTGYGKIPDSLHQTMSLNGLKALKYHVNFKVFFDSKRKYYASEVALIHQSIDNRVTSIIIIK